MKTIVAILTWCCVAFPTTAQNINVTFSATGAATTIDSVTAINLRTSQNVTFPGNAVLVLKRISGIPDITAYMGNITVFPNPCSGDAKVVIAAGKPQNVQIRVLNIIGRVVAQSRQLLYPGLNEFAVSVSDCGIFSVVAGTPDGCRSCKMLCTAPSGRKNRIQYVGATDDLKDGFGLPGMKDIRTGYSLDYAAGDVIHYTCFSAFMTTVISDVPAGSGNMEVEFAGCTDKDGRHYKVVKIGNQIWMAENLAYLPSVNPHGVSDTIPLYYVYGYDGTVTAEARQNGNYGRYGTLYNWQAAMKACPAGWRLPGDDDWKVMERHLGMNESDVDFNGSSRYSGSVGRKLKSTSDWRNDKNGDNSSGFNVLPGGHLAGDFFNLGEFTWFWSSTKYTATLSWYRSLGFDSDGVRRFAYFNKDGYSVRCLKE